MLLLHSNHKKWTGQWPVYPSSVSTHRCITVALSYLLIPALFLTYYGWPNQLSIGIMKAHSCCFFHLIHKCVTQSSPWWQVPSSSWQEIGLFPVSAGSSAWHGVWLWGWRYTGIPGRSLPVLCSTAPYWRISLLVCLGTLNTNIQKHKCEIKTLCSHLYNLL